MAYQAPGVIDSGEEVDRDRARTEILARAFSDVASDYFDRLKRYEDNISDAEDEQERMKQYGLAGAIVGFLLLVWGIMQEPIWLAAVGVLGAAAIGGYAYKRHVAAEERIEDNESKIASNEPDGEVTFISQIGVPFYLVPYEDSHMIFDGLNMASETTLDLANIDGDALLNNQQTLVEQKRTYDQFLGDKTVVPPEDLAEFAPNIREHRRLERPVLERIDDMTQIVQDIEHDTIHANVCANDQKAASVSSLAQNNLFSSGSIPLIEIEQSIEQCAAVVNDIRGVEKQAVSGDMLDQAKESRNLVDEIATELGDRLQTNQQRVTDHYREHGERVEAAMSKHVCTECLHDRIDDIVDELGLVDHILSSETGSLGTALSDEDLDRGTDESFTDHIRSDVEDAVPEIDEELKRAYNGLDDLSEDEGFCQIHGEVETERVADSGALFGEVWRSLYYAFREPIMESVESLEQEAEDIRQTKDQKMVDLTQYEQIKDQAERRYHEVQADYETARSIEQNLG